MDANHGQSELHNRQAGHGAVVSAKGKLRNPTANKDHLEKISDQETRRRGGLHVQHLKNHHSKVKQDCLLCSPMKKVKPADPVQERVRIE
jgi:hypothetical protein